jgi:hypothetical protein
MAYRVISDSLMASGTPGVVTGAYSDSTQGYQKEIGYIAELSIKSQWL